MNFKEYQEQAKRTCPSLGSDKLDLAHMVLGIFSEYEEYALAIDDINKVEEITDMMWYLANYCTFRNYDLNILWENMYNNFYSFKINVSKLQDLTKKYLAYNKEINREFEEMLLKSICCNICEMYESTDIFQALQNNIDKLKIRFPDKFDEDLAKNRDLKSERKELEK